LGYRVRPIEMGDIPQVTEIDRESFANSWSPSTYKHDLRFNRLTRYLVAYEEEGKPARQEVSVQSGGSGPLRWLRRRFSGEVSHPSTGQHILGFAGLWFMMDEVHLTTIAVREAYRRRGIGGLLLISAIELAVLRNARMVTLEVRASNRPAQALYEKYGFRRVGVRRGYYTDNREDAVLMTADGIASASFQAQFQRLKREHAERWGESHLELGE